jgi:hypothetical protein
MRKMTDSTHKVTPALCVAVATLVVWLPIIGGAAETVTRIVRNETLLDPLFGIEFHPSQVKFESAPDAVYTCKGLAERRGNLFLYGQVTARGTHFYLVSGWLEYHPDGPSTGERQFDDEGDGGLLVAVSGAGCRFAGAAYALSPSKKYRDIAFNEVGIDEQLVSDLLDDAIRREAHAFGGREAFQCAAAAAVAGTKLTEQLQAKLDKLGPLGPPCRSSPR